MTEAATDVERTIDVTVTRQKYPRYDASHGTPDPMERRIAELRLPAGRATFEQTDYGHPGRFNAWEPRGIDAKLQPQLEELRAVCDALSRFL
jgi:hypothetical protein